MTKTSVTAVLVLLAAVQASANSRLCPKAANQFDHLSGSAKEHAERILKHVTITETDDVEIDANGMIRIGDSFPARDQPASEEHVERRRRAFVDNPADTTLANGMPLLTVCLLAVLVRAIPSLSFCLCVCACASVYCSDISVA